MQPSASLSFFCVCLWFLSAVSLTSGTCLTDKWYVLANKETGNRLDATSPYASLRFPSGFDAQLWKFECQGRPGEWNIFSKFDTRYALDVNRNNQVLSNVKSPTSYSQVWILNSDGTLWNSFALGYLAFSGAVEKVGEVLVIDPDVTNAVKLTLTES